MKVYSEMDRKWLDFDKMNLEVAKFDKMIGDLSEELSNLVPKSQYLDFLLDNSTFSSEIRQKDAEIKQLIDTRAVLSDKIRQLYDEIEQYNQKYVELDIWYQSPFDIDIDDSTENPYNVRLINSRIDKNPQSINCTYENMMKIVRNLVELGKISTKSTVHYVDYGECGQIESNVYETVEEFLQGGY